MTSYTFDVLLLASITVPASDPETARKMLESALDCADTNFGAYPDGSPIIGEVSLTDDITLNEHLAMVDGVETINQYGRTA